MRWRVVEVNQGIVCHQGGNSRTPATRQIIVKQRIYQLDGMSCAGLYCVAYSRPGESTLIVYLVDLVAVCIVKYDSVSVVTELTFKWAEE